MGVLASSFNVITTFAVIIGWLILVFSAFGIYKRQMERPKVWRVALVIVVGLSSVTITIPLLNEMMKIAILPLGVWILYAILKRKEGRWKKYRPYAWLGFWGNYVFLVTALFAIPIHHAIYPIDEPSTYISNIEEASLINLHPSAKDMALNKENILDQLDTMRQGTFFNEQWYEDTFMNSERSNRERFPYQLSGVTKKWGSGVRSIIFIEDDGKGILISTPSKQFYFRSDVSLIEGGD